MDIAVIGLRWLRHFQRYFSNIVVILLVEETVVQRRKPPHIGLRQSHIGLRQSQYMHIGVAGNAITTA